MPLPFALKPVTVVCGHYGAGKTTISISMALDAAEAGMDVTLVDLDVVNPYFRSSEYRGLLEAAHVHLVAPVFAEARSNLDVPSLTGGVLPAIEAAYAAHSDNDSVPKKCVIIDVGGDDVGATALGRFANALSAGSHDVLYVANRYRNLTCQPEEALVVMREIEAKARVRVTGIIANSHLQQHTDSRIISDALPFARDVALKAGVRLTFVAVPDLLVQQENTVDFGIAVEELMYPVRIHVRTPWDA